MQNIKNKLTRFFLGLFAVAMVMSGISSNARATSDFDYTTSAGTITTGTTAAGTGATGIAAVAVGLLIFGLIMKYTRKGAK